MIKSLRHLERISRQTKKLQLPTLDESDSKSHPFDLRNIHPEISKISRKLFDDGHYSHAVLEAFKFLDKRVSKLSGIADTGFPLMMNALNEKNPKIQLTNLGSESEINEQLGYRHMFAGSMSGIRNPRAHEVGNIDDVDQCLDFLGFASTLIRKIDQRISPI